MCGLAGFMLAPDFRGEAPAAIAMNMASRLVHRGPDGSGVWTDVPAGVGLAHRRLAVIDLTPDGRQPMISASERYVIVYNGEIYNFRTLRRELEQLGASFRGHSDTEVLLAAMDAWGIEQAIRRTVGMFALAVWDRRQRELTLARDRLGEKPLYWGVVDDNLVFGSELKALKVFPRFNAQIDRGSVALLLRHNCIPAPHSIYAGIHKLPPASLLRIKRRTAGALAIGTPDAYWSVEPAFERARAGCYRGSFADATEELDTLLRQSIRDQMIADVPLGAFLSGGIDSSTVVAIMQAESTQRVKTFTIGFQDPAYDESGPARAVAQHLGTDHEELRVTPAEAMQVIPELARIYDEPFADSSQIPTYLVSALARKHVTVALSGDGGDELFCGYNRYLWGRDAWRWARRVPLSLRRAMHRSIGTVRAETWDALLRPVLPLLPRTLRYARPGDRLYKLADLLTVENPGQLYLSLQSHWKTPTDVVRDTLEPTTLLSQRSAPRDVASFVEHMSMLDLQTYLPDDILVKVDRAAMAVSLEGRVPLLDHRIVEFAAALPTHYKLKGRRGKLVLRNALDKYVPRALVERPKTGFGLPIDTWLRQDLRDWADDLLSPSTINEFGILRPEPVTKLWEEHRRGLGGWHYLLWDVLMLQAWLRAERSKIVDRPETSGHVAFQN